MGGRAAGVPGGPPNDLALGPLAELAAPRYPGRAGPGLAAGELVSGAASLPLAGRSNTLPAGHRKQTVTWAGRAGVAHRGDAQLGAGVPWHLAGTPVDWLWTGALTSCGLAPLTGCFYDNAWLISAQKTT